MAIGGFLRSTIGLFPFHQMTFQHDPKDFSGTRAELFGEFAGNNGLTSMILVAVPMAAVDHDAGPELFFFQLGGDGGDRLAIIVGTVLGTAKNEVTAVVSFGLHDCGEALFRDAEETMPLARACA